MTDAREIAQKLIGNSIGHTEGTAFREELTQALTTAREKGRKQEAAKVETLFEAIKHGDDEHMHWLKKAIEDHFAGRPVERVSGLGKTEAEYQRGLSEGRKQGHEEAAGIAAKWIDTGELELRAGEMTAQERRTIRAVLRGVIGQIRGLP